MVRPGGTDPELPGAVAQPQAALAFLEEVKLDRHLGGTQGHRVASFHDASP
jgi:hypothetical protein